MEDLIKIVREELESTETRILTKIKRIFKDGNQASAQRNMKLQFKNSISQIMTGEEIKGDDKNPLEVVLVDESTGNIVDVGPESSATVKILLLKGVSNASEGDDLTIEQFNENIVREVEGKQPLLAGNKRVKLQKGIGSLGNIKFRHNAIQTKPPKFKLGARVVGTFDGVRITEAKTESFVVKDFRNRYYIKHENPSLSDEVSRLVNIRKGGNIEKRLQDHKICTVEDFLIRFLIDPEGLKSIVKLPEKKWELIVNNAVLSPRDKRLYFYTNEQKTMSIVFNLLGNILGLYAEGQYTKANMLSEKYKADAGKLLESAYKNWKKVKPFDDEDSLQQYFNSLDCPVTNHENAAINLISEVIDDEDSLQQHLNGLDCPFANHENAQTSEVIGGSSSRSNFSLSAMNSISEMIGESSSRSNFSLSAMNSISEMIGESSSRSNFSVSAMNSTSEMIDDEDSLLQYLNRLDCPVSNHENAHTSEMIGQSSSRSNFSLSAMNSISEMINDEDSLQQYFNGLDCPFANHENAQTSEAIGGSSSRSNFSLSAMNSIGKMIGESSSRSNFSAINSINETTVEDISSFGTDDVEIMHDAFLQLSPSASFNFNNLVTDFDYCPNQKDNPDMQLNGLANEPNADEFVESKDVGIRSKPQKRWRKLFYVSKWFSIMKKVSEQGMHNRKKQKVSEI